MKKLSIVLLLIGIAFMTIEANNLSNSRQKTIDFKRWEKQQRDQISIPIKAILDENSIEVHFLENVEGQVIFKVKDQQGNIIFQDMTMASNEQDTYKKGIMCSGPGLVFGPGGLVLTIAGSVLINAVEGSITGAIGAGIFG